VVAVTNSTGTLISQQRYLPFGQVHTDVGSITQTDFAFREAHLGAPASATSTRKVMSLWV